MSKEVKKFEVDQTLQVKKYTSTDGVVRYMKDGKLHNWEGPALIPEGNNKKREYYLNGIKMTEKEWKDALRGREGLPWYKGGSAKARF